MRVGGEDVKESGGGGSEKKVLENVREQLVEVVAEGGDSCVCLSTSSERHGVKGSLDYGVCV